MQTTISALPILRRHKPSRAERIKHAVMALALPESGTAKAAGAGGIAVATAAIAGAAYKLRGRSQNGDGNGEVQYNANNAGPVSPPATPTV